MTDFLALWGTVNRGPIEVEYRFAPPRRWRFDYAWPPEKVALEFDGGQWVAQGGRHNRDSDREKLLEAAALGWIVLRISNQQWAVDPWKCIDYVERALEARDEWVAKCGR